MENWYAIQCRGSYEARVRNAFRRSSIEEFWPCYETRRQWSDRIQVIEHSLFPGYLFARFDPAHRVPILSTTGVIKVLGSLREPEPIPESDIENVRILMNTPAALAPCPYFAAGDLVEIEQGPLTGLVGYLVFAKSPARVVVSLEMLGQSCSVEVDATWLRKLAKAA
jgi:transcriptional antiterminator NusG